MHRKSWLISLFALCALGCAESGTKTHPPVAAKASATKEAAKETAKPSVADFEKLVTAVTDAVDNWAAAWAARDIPRYLSAYAPDFTPEQGTRADWEKLRRERIGKADKLRVAVSELQVSSYSPGRATANFQQSYQSANHSEKSKKILELREVGGRWLITREYTP